jgi:hypothetical protein
LFSINAHENHRNFTGLGHDGPAICGILARPVRLIDTTVQAIYWMLQKVRGDLTKNVVIRVVWSIDPDVPKTHEWL